MTDPITRLNAAPEGRYRVESRRSHATARWTNCPVRLTAFESCQ